MKTLVSFGSVAWIMSIFLTGAQPGEPTLATKQPADIPASAKNTPDKPVARLAAPSGPVESFNSKIGRLVRKGNLQRAVKDYSPEQVLRQLAEKAMDAEKLQPVEYFGTLFTSDNGAMLFYRFDNAGEDGYCGYAYSRASQTGEWRLHQKEAFVFEADVIDYLQTTWPLDHDFRPGTSGWRRR